MGSVPARLFPRSSLLSCFPHDLTPSPCDPWMREQDAVSRQNRVKLVLKGGTWVSPCLTALTQMSAPTTTPTRGSVRGPAAPRLLLLWGCANGRAGCRHLPRGKHVGKGHGVGTGLGDIPRVSGHSLSDNSTTTNSQVPTETRIGKVVLKRST